MGLKQQTTIYISKDTSRMLHELLFLRAKKNLKTNRSELFSEGLKMVYDKESKTNE